LRVATAEAGLVEDGLGLAPFFADDDEQVFGKGASAIKLTLVGAAVRMLKLQLTGENGRTHMRQMCMASSCSRPVSVSMKPEPRPRICTRAPVSC
jgi:hypothetical protein